MSGRQELRRAIQATAERKAGDAANVVQLARVTTTNELTIELLDSGVTIHDDEFDLTQRMDAYHSSTGLEVDDTVLLVRKPSSGEIHWIVFDVLADREQETSGSPTGPAGGVLSGSFPNPDFAVDMATQAELDALQAEVDAIETGGGNYEFLQLTPSALWTINHGLGRYPAVEVIDSAGQQNFADVEYVDANTITITFIGAVAGRAILA